ncbi:MAG: Rne/Rng family ribonuclease [Ilumatobacteraceae bacterium]
MDEINEQAATPVERGANPALAVAPAPPPVAEAIIQRPTRAPRAAPSASPPTQARSIRPGSAVDSAPAGDGDGSMGDSADDDGATDDGGPNRKRRRGSRGGRGRSKPAGSVDESDDSAESGDSGDSDERTADGTSGRGTGVDTPSDDTGSAANAGQPALKVSVPRAPRPPRKPKAPAVETATDDSSDVNAGPDADANESESKPARAPRQRAPKAEPVELPERISEGRATGEAAELALVRRPQIGDTRPQIGDTRPQIGDVRAVPRPAIPPPSPAAMPGSVVDDADSANKKKRSRSKSTKTKGGQNGSGGQGGSDRSPARGESRSAASQLDPDVLEKRRGRERNGRPIGRYLMCVQVRDNLTQVAVLEGRHLVEHYVSRPADDVSQIHGNIYVGKVQNVLPGMEAAFVDIATPKNAVLYRGDVQYDQEDIVERGAGAGGAIGKDARIENILKAKQLIVCQVTKNPIGAKGARLTQEVSLPGRFVVLIPHSNTYGISKRLPDDTRKRLRNILDRVKPAEHGLIVRTAAENATEHELRADMTRLLDQWNRIETKAKKMQSPGLLYREPELAVRVIREEFNAEYRGVVIDDKRLFEDVRDYIEAFNPELADRVEYYDREAEGLPIYEQFHLHEQLHKALDRKVWLPSGGSLIIEHTEALSVIDVNTGKNVGTSNSNLEATVFHNNLEAADEIARQLRLRDIGGIIVIDFIDMEIRENRKKVVDAFKQALGRDKTRTQVFDITDLGLVEMTRKRIGEGLLTNFAEHCPNCDGRGVMVDLALLE